MHSDTLQTETQIRQELAGSGAPSGYAFVSILCILIMAQEVHGPFTSGTRAMAHFSGLDEGTASPVVLGLVVHDPWRALILAEVQAME